MGDTYVLGASGYVGRAIAARLGAAGHRVVGTHASTPTPVTDRRYDFWTDDPPPVCEDDRVIFAATVETDDRPMPAFERRAERLVRACADARLVYCSTDAVFAGDAGGYVEGDPTDPATEYGRRSVRFESLVREHCTDHCVVRPSYVYGLSGGVLDDRLAATFRALRGGQRVAYYDDYYKSPVEVNQLAAVVRRVAGSDFRGTLHVGGPRLSVHEFHRRAAAAFGAPTDPIDREGIPPDSSLPGDTSLDSALLAEEFGLRPAGVVESLTCSSVTDALRA